jgi:hypothetical protein
MNFLLEAALGYARRGWRVFPLHGIVNDACTCGRGDCSSPGKHPLVRRGLYEATTETHVIKEWWRRWRSANIGIATGAESGIAVIDVDLPVGEDSLERLIAQGIEATLTGFTGGGGLHLIYRCENASLGNGAGRLPGIEAEVPGIDLRANGGYIVAPPSAHRSGLSYHWLDPERDPGAAPGWLQQPVRSYVPCEIASPANFEGDGTAYGRAALDGALTSLRHAPVGQRNHTLNRCAFALAQLVAGGELLESAVRAGLLSAAIGIGLDEPESRQTIDSAFDAGLAQPRVAPHRRKA